MTLWVLAVLLFDVVSYYSLSYPVTSQPWCDLVDSWTCSASSHDCAFVPDVLSALSEHFLPIFYSNVFFLVRQYSTISCKIWQNRLPDKHLMPLTCFVLYFHLNVCAKGRVFYLFTCFHCAITRDWCIIQFKTYLLHEWMKIEVSCFQA